MVVVPASTPLTTPEPVPIVATRVLLLVQLPPVAASVKDVVKPTHTLVVPVMADGNGFTVTGVVIIQPVPRV